MEHPNYKNESIDKNFFKIMQKNHFSKVKNSLRIRKRFLEKDRELKKDTEVEIKRKIEEMFFKPIIVSLDDIDMFEKKETKKE